MHPWCHTAWRGIVTDSEEVGSSEVGSSGKVSLSEKVVLVLLAVEAVAVKEGCVFLPSRLVSNLPLINGLLSELIDKIVDFLWFDVEAALYRDRVPQSTEGAFPLRI